MNYKDMNSSMIILAIVICIILLLYQLIINRQSKSGKWFTIFIATNTLMLTGDAFQVFFAGVPGMTSFILQNVFTLVVYYAACGIMVLSAYMWVIANIELKTSIHKVFIIVPIILVLIYLIFAITMPFTKVCYIDSNNVYQRGELFFLVMIIPYILYFGTLVLMFVFHKVFSKKEFLSILAFLLSIVAGEIIQVLNPNLLIQNVIVSIGLVAMVCFIQHQREYEKEVRIQKMLAAENKNLEILQRRQSELNDQLIEVLCRAVEAKDVYTRGHSLRVAQYAREIMYRLGGDEKAQNEVYYIGILHDIGKIRVSDSIINKNGKLTDEEYEQIKLHTISGYQVLKCVNSIPNLAIGARWHHERYDGKGYPNGLSGENIPLIARIISVADAYDAMTSNRSYHSIMPQAYVREQIVKGMGTQFDPKIAQIMLDMIDEDVAYDMKQVNYNNIINVIMIDDDPFMHTMVEQILGNEKYVFTFASSGEEGIEFLKENKYDLCLLDKEMPGMNGFEVLEWIHKNIRRMKVILLTGDKDMATIKRGEELGANDYISKPIKVSILKESIATVLKS